MISRKSARLITDIYLLTFSVPKENTVLYSTTYYRALKARELYEFFYERDYNIWFLGIIEKYDGMYYGAFRKLLLGLQTGESLRRGEELTSEDCQTFGQAYLVLLAQDIIKEYESRITQYGSFSAGSDERKLVRALKIQLEIDGFIYKDGRLYYSESSVIDEKVEQEYLEELFLTLKLADIATLQHHLNGSEEHYRNGKYDDSISNSRKVLDVVLTQVASGVYAKVNGKSIPPEMSKNATDIRNFLERQNLVSKVEREALDKNYGALSTTGGHPYIAEKDQARLMRHLALTFSQFVLLRYQGFRKKNP